MQTVTRPTRMTHPWVAQASETIRFGLAYGPRSDWRECRDLVQEAEDSRLRLLLDDGSSHLRHGLLDIALGPGRHDEYHSARGSSQLRSLSPSDVAGSPGC